MTRQPKEKKRRGLKGSDIYLLAMYAGWIAYIVFAAFTYYHTHAWFPLEMTLGTVVLFLYETFALYRLKLANEGVRDTRGLLKSASDTARNFVGSRLGLDGVPDLEDEITDAEGKQHHEG